MFTYLRSFMLIACMCIFMTACEDDSGTASTSSSGDGFLFHVDTTYAQHNTGDGVGTAFPNVLTGDGHNLYTANSAIIVQRPSCSGFSAGSFGDAQLGWNLRFYYNMDETDLSQSPTRYYPTEIYLWPDTCENPFGETATPGTNTCNNPCNTGCSSCQN